ncbi:hypothetical protein AO501_25135 [Mycobacterium gordonae]|uniref:Uncharacterized protein n=1 Tax=Mycobacterium gordonae TaxID=1778 RepID=A0A0Q2X283_MYCGO|nr:MULTISPECIES: hypothetical protein [Mycobacterium]KQH75564.1 hypothetical protein AO501_25135 [Mycobacterium gordonae]MDP7732122.1 hypothetical protein [Mycobacterium sp. TY813]
MTAFRDRLTPTRTPAEHFAIADRLVGELDQLHVHELQLPYAKAKLALADIHARLAGCTPLHVVNNSVVDNQPTERN